MQKTLVKYGLISGSILAVLLFASMVFYKNSNIEGSSGIWGMVWGYTYMAATFSLIYFGVKSFRDTYNAGSISFIKALLVGLGIMLIACIIYSIAWVVIYHNYMPTYMDDYIKVYIQNAQKSGQSQAELANTIKEFDSMKEMYKNPLMVFLITILEPTPVGVVISLISAFILKKK